MTTKKDRSQQTENSSKQAIEVLKALSHFEFPREASQVETWLRNTKPLQSLVKNLCERDKTGRLTLDCVYVLFDILATRGESVSPAVWDILDIVEEDEVKSLLETFLKESTFRLKNGLCAMVSGVLVHGQRVQSLEVWCYSFIRGLEEKQKYCVLRSATQEFAPKLLHGVVLPYTREVAFSLFERLMYPMTYSHVFYSLLDQLAEVFVALEKDELCDRFSGLLKTLLERFPARSHDSYKILKAAVNGYPDDRYNPDLPVWNEKQKSGSKLSNILECPVCYERFVTPIAVCENGHCICSNCKNHLQTCPICRGHMSKIRMTIMDQIMQATEFRCKNSDAGCSVKLPYKDIRNHEEDCEYRTVACDIVIGQKPSTLVCKEDVVFAHFHRHLEKCHKNFVTEFELSTERRGELRWQRTNDVKLLKISNGNLYFIERIYVTDEQIFFSYHYVGKSEDAKNYVYTLKICGSGVPQKIRYSNFCLPNYMGVLETEVNERCLILEPEKIFSAQLTKVEYSVKIEEMNAYRIKLTKNKFLPLN